MLESLTTDAKHVSMLLPLGVLPYHDAGALVSLLTEPQSVCSLAAALRACPHPAQSLACIDTTDPALGEGTLFKCAFCGASAHVGRGEQPQKGQWLSSVLVDLLATELFRALTVFASGLREVALGARLAADIAALGGNPARMTEGEGGALLAHLRELAAAAHELTTAPPLGAVERIAALLEDGTI